MNLRFHPGAILQEKIQGRVKKFKTMDTKRVERRATARVFCAAPLVFFLWKSLAADMHGQDPSGWLVCSGLAFALLLAAFKQFGGQRGLLWGAWLWLLSVCPYIAILNGWLIVIAVWILVSHGADIRMILFFAFCSLLFGLCLYGRRQLTRIEMGER
jgi:hypothetical protein